jgi:hypothetical protein
MFTAAGMRRRTTYNSAMTIIMNVAPPVITAAEKKQIRPRHHHLAAVTSASVHPTHTSRQGRQQRNPQPNLDSVNQTVRLVHTDLPFAEEIKECGCARNTTRRAVIKSPDVNSMFCLTFMRRKITLETFPSLWGITLPCVMDGAPRKTDPAGDQLRKEKAPADFPPAQMWIHHLKGEAQADPADAI